MKASEKILRLIAEKRWILSDLAQASGIKYTTLRNYVGAKPSNPPVDNAIRIARALFVPTDWLFDDDRDFPIPSQEMPPVSIRPWPPHGITWEEIQIAINEWTERRIKEELAKHRKYLEERAAKIVIEQATQPQPGASTGCSKPSIGSGDRTRVKK